MYVLYTLGLCLVGLVCLPMFVWRSVHGAGYHRDVLERLGYGAIQRSSTLRDGVWFHAASVGEVQGLQPIIAHIRECFPALPIVCSTFTPTGKLMAQRLVPDRAAVFLLPFDFSWIMRRLVRRFRPRAIVVQETELWPHLFRAAAQWHVPVVVVNGRLSPRAFRRYAWFRGFMRRVLADVTLVLAQSEMSAERFRYLGVSEERLHVVGNTNIDRVLQAAEHVTAPKDLDDMLHGRPVLVAGSTHDGEETLLLSVYRSLRAICPKLCLVLAPRHVERAEAVARVVRSLQFRAVYRSQCRPGALSVLGDEDVVVLDTLGELAPLYRLCTIAFVGGSFASIGGHNILEPAVYAKPVFFGPHMHHFPELATMLCDAGGALQVQNAEALYAGMARIVQCPGEGERMGQRARCTLMANRGALEQTHRRLATLLQERVAWTPL